ncbi:glycerate kinase [Chitinophaga oryzae]|uniref:Glycerate kinase n=1 Tax=Chitinophaga oryzae TaxID=2725414 RepID=A0AAE7D9Z5_9BACT|nr:glycerate kinase [Chitinophaga oryzae]QJB33769.1 glycerate kinase [Chitinophaga oryzae]QJB40293.1 glycerate kinase [Chitinophaga oryzae]
MHAVSAVHPVQLIRRYVQVKAPSTLVISGDDYVLPPQGRLIVLGAGKASAAMAQELEKVLEGHLRPEGFIVTKYGHSLPLQHLELLEAGHPVPDEHSLEASRRFLETAAAAGENDVVILLLSGGASALLADVPEGSSLADVQQVFTLLLNSGAGIHEINIVRKHLSKIKGGWLAQNIYPATLCALVLSDVVGDDLSVIGSGPAVPDPSTFADAVAILEKYRLPEQLPLPLRRYLADGVAGIIPDTPKAGDVSFSRVHHYLAGTNHIALQAAADKARSLGYHAQVLASDTTGDAHTVAETLAAAALAYEGPRPACLLAGGETTVQVTGNGKGGRNQQLVLAAAIALAGHEGITLLSAGTDGTDGPTNAAGAIADGHTLERAAALQLDARDFLQRQDAWTFFSKAGGLLITGPTQTNVMDLMMVLLT